MTNDVSRFNEHDDHDCIRNIIAPQEEEGHGIAVLNDFAAISLLLLLSPKIILETKATTITIAIPNPHQDTMNDENQVEYHESMLLSLLSISTLGDDCN